MKRFYSILLLLLMIGCTTPRSVEKPHRDESPFPTEVSIRQEATVEKDPFLHFPEKFYREAILLEKSGDPLKALAYWKVVQRFRPNSAEINQKVLKWEAWAQQESEKHFLKGLERLEQNSIQEARRAFLLALAYDPDHPQALHYLKNHLHDPVWIFYDVKKGDSLKRISQEIYQDPDKDFLIAYFNHLHPQDSVPPGRMLKLPLLPSPSDKKVSPKDVSPKASELSKPDRWGVSSQEQAEIHYAKGMKYFLSDEFEKAIEQWEETLRLHPNHPYAKRDLQRAQNLLRNLRKRP